ncbi:MAG: hypothetical protein Q7S27_03020 [Nanoarchaeota archaeon]|nr:hypothetical protein [Nanoarchaeota archaeon]
MPKKVKTEKHIEDRVLENLIELQKVHTNLAEKFDKLSKEISNLLSLFELAARNFSKHPALKASEGDKEFLDKIDKLLEQNKTIAKGLTLMEDHIRKKVYSQPAPIETHAEQPEHAQEITEGRSTDQEGLITEEYSPSMKSNNRPLPRF